MMTLLKKNRGFTLVELLVVAVILGIAIGAVYSIYITHMRNAYNQDEVVDVQQNLRIAMDTLSRDFKMAGLLDPLTTNPLASGLPLNNYSTSVTINATSPGGRFSRITQDSSTVSGSSSFTANVAFSPVLEGFAVGDTVRIIRPFDNSRPLTGTLVVSAVDTAAPSITISSAVPFSDSTIIKAGDVFAKSTGTGDFDTVTYTLVTNAGNSDCPVGQRCLARTVNGVSPATIIASNLSSLRFSYLYDVNSEDNNPSDPNKIRAIRVTITGVTTKKTDPNWVPKSRQISSVIKVRNRRIY
ncbi:MAG: prepilin-type N-terminal cleavage/methylation domain-containing protein [Deltaproteobacteria bacterium]|nr:prepilin-type N-terminal cleavage/methylation domain-containing protein [Deltaproteobacteria bacterium]TLN05146.1 MAG: prepilin-type N-terminal cleavage/methylation domain-containing protein [bacterium]